MNRKSENNPFEDLKDFNELGKLTKHIIESLRVEQITAFILASKFKLIKDPDRMLPVDHVVVGNATFAYIRHRAEDVMSSVKLKIQKLNQNTELGIADKLQEYENIRTLIEDDYRYFDSMNPIRYMSSYKWMISYDAKEKGKIVRKVVPYANSKLDLTSEHWTEIDNTFSIRRHLLYEILYLIHEEIRQLELQLKNVQYTWDDKKPYDLYELLFALIASKRVKYGRGNEAIFVHDFLQFFGLSDKKLAYSRGKVLDRQTRSQFLTELEEALERYGKTTNRKS